MFTKYMAPTLAALLLGAGMASAATCGGLYKVQRGDTLSQIADSQYKDAKKWSAIYRNNVKRIGENPNNIRLGAKYTLPCIDGLPTGLEGGQEYTGAPVVSSTTKTASASQPIAVQETASTRVQPVMADGKLKIRLLTADDYAPFTDRDVLNGGLINDVVETALKSNNDVDGFEVYWVNDWSAHLDPLLSDQILDVGFPWLKPDCDSTPENFRCKNFDFSDPMFEMLILLFTNKANPIAFDSDADLIGKTLCRPAGYYTHDLEKNGRLWITNKKIKLEQPNSVADCFDMLVDGKVDAVAINEFTGRAAIKKQGLADKVDVVATRPLSIEGLHIVVHKTHPQAKKLLNLVNASLDGIKESGAYQKVIDVHMSKIWEDF